MNDFGRYMGAGWKGGEKRCIFFRLGREKRMRMRMRRGEGEKKDLDFKVDVDVDEMEEEEEEEGEKENEMMSFFMVCCAKTSLFKFYS